VTTSFVAGLRVACVACVGLRSIAVWRYASTTARSAENLSLK